MHGNMKGRHMKKNSGGVNYKSKSSSRRKKRSNFLSKFPKRVLNYLNSDSYLYSYLIASSSPSINHSASHDHVHRSGLGRSEPALRNNEGELKQKFMGYLKSDDYLYAPLGDTRHRDNVFVKNVIASPREQELQFTRVTSSVISRGIAWQTKQVAKDPIISHKEAGKVAGRDTSIKSPTTPVIPEAKKQARRSGRLSTLSG